MTRPPTQQYQATPSTQHQSIKPRQGGPGGTPPYTTDAERKARVNRGKTAENFNQDRSEQEDNDSTES